MHKMISEKQCGSKKQAGVCVMMSKIGFSLPLTQVMRIIAAAAEQPV